MQVANRVAINTGFLYARMAVTVFISLYTTRLIIQALGTEDFGIFNLVGGVIAMLTFLNTSMAVATQRFMSFAEGAGDLNKLKNIFSISVVLHVIISLLLVVLFECVGHYLFENVLSIPEARISVAKLIFQYMIVSTAFSILSVPYEAAINAHEEMFMFAIVGIIEALLKLSIAVYIVNTSQDKLLTYGFLTAGISAMLLIIRGIYCHSKYKECQFDIKSNFDRPIFIEMSKFAGWSLLGTSTSMIANYGQSIVLNIFFGPLVNAAQGIAGQVSGQLGAFSVTMLKAVNPLIAKSEGAGNRALMLKATSLGSKLSFFLLIFFYVPVLIEMPFIFKLWLNSVPPYAIVFCRLLLVRNLIEQVFITLITTISASGNIRKYQVYSSSLALLPLLLSYFFFKLMYPAYYMYVIFGIFSLLSGTVTLYFAKENSGLSINEYINGIVWKCLLVLMIILSITFLPFLLMLESVFRLIVITSISSFSFVVVVWIIGLTKSERLIFKNLSLAVLDRLVSVWRSRKMLFARAN